MYQSIADEAWGLVHSLATQCVALEGLGTMSPVPYDTAWVAMTEKRDHEGKPKPLFPEAYDYLKSTQSEDGSWAADISDTDGIINTLAALLALKKQERQFEAVRADNERRCQAAEESLHQMLETWNLDATDRVGMEVLIPNLLRLLEDEGIVFDFPCRKSLMVLNAAKLARLGPILTSPIQTTLIHTLEAFVGTLDFDKVKQHKMPNGSMLASPSSTAAYLMNASEWDEEAEGYLQMVFEQQLAMGRKGGFPSAFPSTIFEVSWVLDLLLEAGFDKESFLLADIRNLTVLLEENLKRQKGVVGWARDCLPDADDTAKTISALRLLGWDKDIEPMLKAFEADDFFITYRGERNASSSANCNILLCLLRTSEPAKYTKQIIKCAKFLCKSWTRTNGPDKWHTSIHYPMMLIAQSLMLLLKRWAKKELDTVIVPPKLMYQDIPRTLLDILGQTMRLQEPDGSWESKREVTAYAVLTLAPLLSLPWVDFLKPEGIACMYRGKAYLEDHRPLWRQAERIWIEKTVYGSSNLSHAYCLAASKIIIPTAFMSAQLSDMFPTQLAKKMARMSGSFSQVISLSLAPKWQLQLSLLQSVNYAAALKESRHKVFPPVAGVGVEIYQDYIPYAWIGCKDILATSMPAATLWDMILAFMLSIQADAYIQTVAWGLYRERLPELKALIRAICSGTPEKRKRMDKDDTSRMPKRTLGSNGIMRSGDKTKAAVDLSSDISSSCHRGDAVDGTEVTSEATDQPGSRSSAVVHQKRVDSPLAGEVDDEVEFGALNSPGKHGASEGEARSIVNGGHTNGECISASPEVSSDGSRHASSPVKNVFEGMNGAVQPLDEHGSDVAEVLTKFVNSVLQHPKVLQSPAPLREWLTHELQAFLLAHVAQMEDCEASPDSSTWSKSRTTFSSARTISTEYSNCPYLFVFFLCLIDESARPIMASLHQRYALEDVCHHLAVMCRQHNVLGAVLRNQENNHLNGTDSSTNGAVTMKELVEQEKQDVLAVAEYERRCLNRIVGELEHVLDPVVVQRLRLFIHVAELHGQMYVARDIGVRRIEENRRGRAKAAMI